jgi:hypothetical protein
MFDKFVNTLKTLFNAKPVSLQFEEMLLQEAVQELKDAEVAKEKVAEVEAKATVAKARIVAKANSTPVDRNALRSGITEQYDNTLRHLSDNVAEVKKDEKVAAPKVKVPKKPATKKPAAKKKSTMKIVK